MTLMVRITHLPTMLRLCMATMISVTIDPGIADITDTAIPHLGTTAATTGGEDMATVVGVVDIAGKEGEGPPTLSSS